MLPTVPPKKKNSVSQVPSLEPHMLSSIPVVSASSSNCSSFVSEGNGDCPPTVLLPPDLPPLPTGGTSSVTAATPLVQRAGPKPSFVEADGTIVVPVKSRSNSIVTKLTPTHPPLRATQVGGTVGKEEHDKASTPVLTGNAEISNAHANKNKKKRLPYAIATETVYSFRPQLSVLEERQVEETAEKNKKKMPETQKFTDLYDPEQTNSPPLDAEVAGKAGTGGGDTSHKHRPSAFHALQLTELAEMEESLVAAANPNRNDPKWDSKHTAEDESEEVVLVVCPLKSLGSCPIGRHSRKEMTQPHNLHEHIVAVARNTQELKEDQITLQEQYISLLKKHKNQGVAMKRLQNEVEQLRQFIIQSNSDKGKKRPSSRSDHNGSQLGIHSNDSNNKGSDGGEGSEGHGANPPKCLPRDVSYTDDFENEQVGTLDELSEERRQRGLRKTSSYVNRLRQRTSSAAHLYDRASLSPSPSPCGSGGKILAEVPRTPNLRGGEEADISIPCCFSSYQNESAISAISSVSSFNDMEGDVDPELEAMRQLIRSPTAGEEGHGHKGRSLPRSNTQGDDLLPNTKGRRVVSNRFKNKLYYPDEPASNSMPSLNSTTRVPLQFPPPMKPLESDDNTPARNIGNNDENGNKPIKHEPVTPRHPNKKSRSVSPSYAGAVHLTREPIVRRSEIEMENVKDSNSNAPAGAKKKRDKTVLGSKSNDKKSKKALGEINVNRSNNGEYNRGSKHNYKNGTQSMMQCDVAAPVENERGFLRNVASQLVLKK